MKKHSDEIPDWDAQRNRIIGLGETSIRKSYYPELQQRILELEKKNEELQAAYEEQTATAEELRQQIEETGRKELELKESEERFRNLIEASPIPVVLSRDGRFIYTNSAFCRMVGYNSCAELQEKTLLDFIAPECKQKVAGYVRARSLGEPVNLHYEAIGIRRDGSRFPYEVTVAVIPLSDGPVTMAFISDITDRKRSEEILKESEEFLTSIVENIPLMLFVKDAADLRFVRLNKAGEDLLGYTRDDLLGKNDYDLFPKEIADFFTAKDREALRSNTPLDIPEEMIETRVLGKRILHTRKIPVLDRKGNPRYLLGISEDITALRRDEEALRTSEERYRSLVNITDTGYLVLDNRGLVIDANDVYLRLTGRDSVADLIGHPVTDWTAPHDLDRNAREVEKCMKTGHVRGLEIDYLKPDGTIQPVEINATVFHAGSGDIVLTLCRDIADRKRTNESLQQARNKLNLLNAVTFQDIQTATFSLSAYQELIKNVLKDPKAKSYVEKQEMFLQKMIDTLDFARNYQEMGIHPPRWQNVRQVFLYAISHLDFLPIHQNLQLENLEIFADPLLEKALFNIMENVLAHGVRATEVTLRFEVRPDGLLLIIEDNGVGIPAEEKNMIFDRGYGKGTGLGLFLVREVLSITGMTIKETGAKGQGTRFEIYVPKGVYRLESS